MSSYNHTKENLHPQTLVVDIVASGITKPVIGITQFDDGIVNIEFTTALTTTEQTTLTSVVAAHEIPIPVESVRCVELSFAGSGSPYITVKQTTFVTVARFIFQGSNRVGSITSANIAMDVDLLSEAVIRLYDHTNGNEMGTVSGITNNDLEIIEIDPITNIPTTSAILELQVKLTDTGLINLQKQSARVHCLTIDFD